jgi:hypothetical protein
MTKLIVAFRNFANATKNASDKVIKLISSENRAVYETM